jgi:DHA2 family multidrug resistance protein
VFDSALILMPRAGVMVFLAPIAGRLYNYVDSRLLIGAGIALMLVGYYDMAHFNLDVGGRQMLRSLLFSVAGMAFMFSVLTAASMRTMPLPLMMAAASLYTLSRRIGGNIGYAFSAGLISRRSAVHRARLVDHITPYDAATQQTVYEMTIGLGDRGLPPGVVDETVLKLVDLKVNRHAAMLAYNDVFWMMGMLFVLSLPFLFLLGSRTRNADSGGTRAAAEGS